MSEVICLPRADKMTPEVFRCGGMSHVSISVYASSLSNNALTNSLESK